MGWWPSWKEFIDDLKNFEQRLSEYQIRAVKDLGKIQGRHPVIVGVILRWALGNLDKPFGDVAQNIIDRFAESGNDQGLSGAILDYLKKIESGGEAQYNKIGQSLMKNFETIRNSMAKEDTVLLIQKILISTGDALDKKLNNLNEIIKAKQEAESRPFVLTDDIEKLGLVQKGKIEYIARQDDEKIRELLASSSVVIRGQPGAGKSSLLYKTLHFLKEKNYNNFVLILDFFREETINALDQELQKIDNFVIVWDNLHQKEKELVENTIKQIERMTKDKKKNFRFIGATRSYDDFSFDVSYLDLESFKDRKIVQECSTTFGIKLVGIDADYVLGKSDGTPYYVISLFEQLKAKGRDVIKKEDLENLPSNVISLWDEYIINCELKFEEITAFQSMALAYHAMQGPPEVSDIALIYENVFLRNEQVEIPLDNLVERSLLSKSNSIYYAHDSHIDALEKIYPIAERYISSYVNELENLLSLWNLGLWALDRKLSDIGLECFDRITSLDQNAAGAWIIMGLLLVKQDPNKALEYFKNATDADPKHAAGAWYNMGLLLEDQGNPDKALEYYENATDADPKYAKAWNNRGLLLVKQDPNKALEYFKNATDADPKYAKAWNNMGLLLAKQDPNKALEYYENATNADPKDADAWYNMGLLLEDQGNPDKALEYYENATDIDPKHADAWYNMGLLLVKQDPNKALEYFKNATDADPKDADAWYNKALCNILKDSIDEGLDDLEKAITLGGKEYAEYAKTEPIFKKIRDNPRFRRMVDL